MLTIDIVIRCHSWFEFKFPLLLLMVHQFSLQGEFQVRLSCFIGMNEMDEFKFRPVLSYLLIKFLSKLEIHWLNIYGRRFRRLCTSGRPKTPIDTYITHFNHLLLIIRSVFCAQFYIFEFYCITNENNINKSNRSRGSSGSMRLNVEEIL